MAANGKDHILLIKADLVDGVADETARAAWRNAVGRSELFEEVRDGSGRLTHYGLLPANLAAIVSNESTPHEKGELREVLAEGAEESRRAMLKHGAETGADGITRIEAELPFTVAAGDFRTHFHRMALRATKLAAEGVVSGRAERAAIEMGQALARVSEGWDKEDAELWKSALESERHAKNWEGTTVLSYSPDTGMISAIPHKGEGGSPLGAHDTHVVAQDGGRRPLAVFAGLPSGELFRQAVAEAYLETYLEGDTLTHTEAEAFERGLAPMEKTTADRKRWAVETAESLLSGVRGGVHGKVDEAWALFKEHYRDKTDCPFQVGTAVNGGVHIGVLPSATLGKLFDKLATWNLRGDGVMAITPEGEESAKIASRYGRMWTPERREDRMTIVNHSDRKFKEGSVGFIRVMRGEFLGATQSGEDPGDRKIAAMLGPEGSYFDDGVLGKLDQMLMEIEDKYGAKGDQGPASLPELCDRFLSAEKPGARSPWKTQYRNLRVAYEQYRAARGGVAAARSIAASEKLYDAMAAFMVSRFGLGGGEEGSRLRAAAKALVSSAAKTGYLYLISDPAGSAVKVGITTNLPERLDDLARENGPMCLVACYAFKSIPVSSWGTQLVSDAVEGKATDTFVALTGLRGESARVGREAARKKFSNLKEAFGFGRGMDDDEPSDFTAFCIKGMLSLCDEDEKRTGGRGVDAEGMLSILRGKTGVDRKLCEPLAELWGQYLKGEIAGTDPSYQRDTLKALNKVILSIVAGGKDGTRLAEHAEKSYGLLGVEGDDRDRVYKYGGQVGPAVAEAGTHRLFSFARRDKGEFFYLGGNFEQIMDLMGAVAGGGEAHRYLLGESEGNEWGGRGQVARKMRIGINTVPKPDITLSWSGGAGGSQARIMELWKSAKRDREKARVEAGGGAKGVRKSPENDCLPVHLQLARELAGKGGVRPKVKDVIESVRQLLGMDSEVFAMKLRSRGILAAERTEYKSDKLRDTVIQAARDTIAETGRGAEDDIPPAELVEFVSNPKGERSQESRNAARQAVLGIKFSGEGEKPGVHALRMALGSGMGEHGLGGYPVSGRTEEKMAWREAVEGGAGPFRAPGGGYSGERVPVSVEDITAAADALDREFTQGTPTSRMILETYGAVVCGCMPMSMKTGRDGKALLGKGAISSMTLTGTAFHSR